MKPEIEIYRIFDANISLVWKAVTEKEFMKQWYFDLQEFKPEVGFIFEFFGGHEDGIRYKHICEVTEVEFEKKLVYSWKYDGYEGISFVTFELSEEDGKTKMIFSHRGLSSFPNSNPDFDRHNFEEGWDHFINRALPAFLSEN
ncbi:MAG: SRPBCC domain-containing protein [Saprospiraceae bacterium]|nr:SRPBCC domain-containing protein [Saprospiraceae bacterium]